MSKYEVPTLLEDMGTMIGVDNETFYILQVYVPHGYEPETVAKLINDRTCSICYCRKFIGLDANYLNSVADYVYINIASGVAYRLPEVRKQIREVLQAEYDKSGSDVKGFLRTINACASGSKFALQYDSMWDVWNALIDQEQWPYFGYTVNQILNDDLKYRLKPFKLVNIERIRNMKDFYSQTYASVSVKPTAVFSTEYLKSINPFKRPDVKHEN